MTNTIRLSRNDLNLILLLSLSQSTLVQSILSLLPLAPVSDACPIVSEGRRFRFVAAHHVILCIISQVIEILGGHTESKGDDEGIYMGARSFGKATSAIAKIKEIHPAADLHVLLMDNKSLESVMMAVKTFKFKEAKLHGLILNARIMAAPFEVTKDGFESQIQTNYLTHWLLANHLSTVLLTTALADGSGSARIIVVSSEGHHVFGVKKTLYSDEEVKNFGSFSRCGPSKLANVLHAKTLIDQFGPDSSSAKEGTGEIWTANLYHGLIDTQLNVKNKEMAS